MIFGGEELEQRRTALGLGFLVLGLLLLMWAWGSWMYRTSTATKPIAITRSADTDEDTEKAVRIAPSMLLGGLLLVVVFLVGTLVFVRASRRYRQSLTRRPSPPSDSRDVWSMHKLKDFSSEED